MSSIGAYTFLRNLPHYILPDSREGRKTGKPSNSEIRRWLKNRAVTINGETPLPEDEIELPIKELIFFINSRSKTTLFQDAESWEKRRQK